jgi:Tfp pilus assembly protein PilN
MINLLPPAYPRSKSFNEKLIVVIISLSILTLLIIGSSFYLQLVFKNKDLDRKLEIANEKLNSISSLTKDIKDIENKKEKLQQSLAKRDKVISKAIYWPVVLNQLQKLIPENSWLVGFDIQEHKKLKMVGYTIGNNDLKLIVDNLRNSKYFLNIKVNLVRREEISYYKGFKAIEGIHYEITGEINENLDLRAINQNGGDDFDTR